MAKKKDTTEVAVHNPELAKNLQIIEAFKAEIDSQANNCLQIKVVDESTLPIAQQNLAKINQLVKNIDEKRVQIKEPYLQAGKLIDSTCKSIAEIAVKAVEHLKNEIKNWEEERKRKAAEAQAELDRQLAEQAAKNAAEEKRKQDIQDYINNKAIPTLKQIYEDCNTPEKCETSVKVIQENYKPREFFQEYADQAYSIRDNYLELIRAKKTQLESAGTMSEAEKQLAKQKEELAQKELELAAEKAKIKAAEEAIEAERKAKEEAERIRLEQEKIAALADLEKTKGLRSNWKFELVDKSKLIPDWIAVDESAVKEYLKANKDNLQDGTVINGIKFYKETSVVA